MNMAKKINQNEKTIRLKRNKKSELLLVRRTCIKSASIIWAGTEPGKEVKVVIEYAEALERWALR